MKKATKKSNEISSTQSVVKRNEKKFKEKFPHIQLVNSLENLQPLTIYGTTNKKVLNALQNNRGADAGTNRERIAKYFKLIKDGQFFFYTIHAMVNSDGILGDGNHRTAALLETGNVVLFYITPEEKFNRSEKETKKDFRTKMLKSISLLNASNTKWSRSEVFKACVTENFELAKNMTIAKQNLKTMAKQNQVTTIMNDGQLYDFVSDFLTKRDAPQTTVEMYDNPELNEFFILDETQKRFYNMAKIIVCFKLKVPTIRGWAVVRRLRQHEKITGNSYNWDLLYKIVQKLITTNIKMFYNLADQTNTYDSVCQIIIKKTNDTKFIKKLS